MSEPIVSIDTSEIRPGKLEELKTGMEELAEFVDANEPRTIAYFVSFNEEGSRMTVVQVHPDSASMEFHMEVAGPVFSRFTGMVRLMSIDLYGSPSDRLRQQMGQKAKLLGDATLVVHDPHAGFTRITAR
jgi:hypothetical protein